MTDFSAVLAERVRRAVHYAGLAQRDVARRVGIDETKLSKSLHGQRRFTPAELTELATVTGVTVSWLLSGSEGDTGTAKPPAPAAALARAEEPRDQAQRRRVIAEKAWELFAERGVEEVRIADIATAAGLSPASVHYYYAGKAELFDEALRYSVKLAYDRQVAELDSEQGPFARLRRLLELQTPGHPSVWAEWSIWSQAWARTAVRTGQPGPHDDAYDRWQQTVGALVTECLEAGVFASASDAAEITVELTALMDGLGIKVLTGRLEPEGMSRQLDRYLAQWRGGAGPE